MGGGQIAEQKCAHLTGLRRSGLQILRRQQQSYLGMVTGDHCHARCKRLGRCKWLGGVVVVGGSSNPAATAAAATSSTIDTIASHHHQLHNASTATSATTAAKENTATTMLSELELSE